MGAHKDAVFDDLHDSKIRVGVDAAKGTPQGNGDTYYATDTDTFYVGDGGAWVAIAGVSTFTGLTDTNFTSLQDNDIAQYDSGTAKWLNVPVPSPAIVGAQVQTSGDETVTTITTPVVIDFASEVYDTSSFWAVSPNPDRITIPSDGFYEIIAHFANMQITSGSGDADFKYGIALNSVISSNRQHLGSLNSATNVYGGNTVIWHTNLDASDIIRVLIECDTASRTITFYAPIVLTIRRLGDKIV